MHLEEKYRSSIIMGTLFILSMVGGLAGYALQFQSQYSSYDMTFHATNIMRYVLIGAGGIVLILYPRRSVRDTIIITGLIMVVWSFGNIYINLIFKKLYFSLSVGDFVIGFLSIFIGFIIAVNTIVFIFDPTKKLTALTYCCITNITLVIAEVIFVIRHGNTFSNATATGLFAVFFTLSQIYMIGLLSSKGIKHLTLLMCLQKSIRRIRDGLGTNSGISIDRSDLDEVIRISKEGMDTDRVDFFLKTHYANVFRLVLIKNEDNIQFLIVTAKSNSLMDGYNSTLCDIQILEDKDIVRFYGDDLRFIQLIIGEFDEKTKGKLINYKY